MRLPRGVSADRVVRVLERLGYIEALSELI
jgi:hypothetical protein